TTQPPSRARLLRRVGPAVGFATLLQLLLHHHHLQLLELRLGVGHRHEVDELDLERQVRVRRHALARLRVDSARLAVGQRCRDVDLVLAALLHLHRRFAEAGDHLLERQRGPLGKNARDRQRDILRLIEHRAVVELADVLHEHDVGRLRIAAGSRGDRVDIDPRNGEPGIGGGERDAEHDAEEQHDQRVAAHRLQGNTGDFGHGRGPETERARDYAPTPLWLSSLPVASELGWPEAAGSSLDAVALRALALELAGAADRRGLFAGPLLARLFVVAAQLHLAVHALSLQLLLERAQGLLDIVVADDDLHKPKPPLAISDRESPRDRRGLHQNDSNEKRAESATGPARTGARIRETGAEGKVLGVDAATVCLAWQSGYSAPHGCSLAIRRLASRRSRRGDRLGPALPGRQGNDPLAR